MGQFLQVQDRAARLRPNRLFPKTAETQVAQKADQRINKTLHVNPFGSENESPSCARHAKRGAAVGNGTTCATHAKRHPKNYAPGLLLWGHIMKIKTF